MITEEEIKQASGYYRDNLSNEELESLGKDIGHYVRPEYTEVVCDSTEGYLVCECGWKSKNMKANWFRQAVQGHLEAVTRQDSDEGSEDSAAGGPEDKWDKHDPLGCDAFHGSDQP